MWVFRCQAPRGSAITANWSGSPQPRPFCSCWSCRVTAAPAPLPQISARRTPGSFPPPTLSSWRCRSGQRACRVPSCSAPLQDGFGPPLPEIAGTCLGSPVPPVTLEAAAGWGGLARAAGWGTRGSASRVGISQALCNGAGLRIPGGRGAREWGPREGAGSARVRGAALHRGPRQS